MSKRKRDRSHPIKPPRDLKRGVGEIKRCDSNNEFDGPFLFSLKHLDQTHKKFPIPDKKNYFNKFLERLQRLSNENVSDLMRCHGSRRGPFKFHAIEWENTSEKSGFRIPKEAYGEECWQFSVTRNEHGRVHGFFIGPTFYIVWLDPDHKLYPVKKKNT
jgi:hypothetical protein